ncbi:helix-turn-helix domain-containing protein [Actinomadura xylanilytica]|uniref:PucR family transcriptional regulator n=1 Tax=Actinomadura xylanilytica TaxID=887459 RepID=UPI00255A7335|nr:PucR family transcriptional regulator [Actinomadura xylanilytica]MDL4775554.1 helix-turn-helix domain-containing protein [Actinomadura xylanilytica]
MTETRAGRAHRPGPMPPQVIAILSAELPSLAEEVISEVRSCVAEYARPTRPPEAARSGRPPIRVSVEQAMQAFVDQVAGSRETHERRDELCRALGRSEAYEGRSLDALQAAYRIGVQVAWRRVAQVGRRGRLSPAVMTQLADALFAYIDELASLSVQGYLEARSRSADELVDHQRRLLRLVLRRPGVPGTALEEPAAEAGWTVPGEVTMVALPVGARCVRAALGGDVLADLGDTEPHLLLPGPFDASRREMLVAALPERRSVVGLTVPLADAADSLRWAKETLALVEAGVVEDGGPTLCEHHMLALWLLSDGALLDQLARRELSALARMGRGQRLRMTETLGAWLEAQGNAVETARRLRVHPQTVRYRMRQISETFDEQLADPDSRFVLDAVLRAHRLRERRPSLR